MPPKKPTELSPDQRKTIAGLEARIAAIRGDKLTERQQRALDFVDREDKERMRNEILGKFPKREYLSIIRRSQKALDEQALKFDLPILRGDTIDLTEVIEAFHELLADVADRLGKEPEDRNALECEKLRAQIAQMNHRTELLKLDFARENADSIHRAEVRRRLAWISDNLRQFGTMIGVQYGKGAQKLLNDLLAKMEKEVREGRLSMEPPIE